MVSKLDSTLFLQQQALTLRAHRQEVLAGNIANADTPHYQARDFDFATALQGALTGRGERGLTLVTTAPGHIRGSAAAPSLPLMYRQPLQASVDGNTVEMDVERAEFADNSLYYEAGVTFISQRLRSIMSAVQGQ